MADTILCLDRSKPFSTCHGERIPEDPHYRVHYFQTYKLGKEQVTLPFDVSGELIEDEKTAPYAATVEGKSVIFQPLYTAKMRELVEKLRAKNKQAEPAEDESEDDPVVAGATVSDDDSVNLAAWLKGTAKYNNALIKNAVKARYSLNLQSTREIVIALVLDEKLVAEDQVAPNLKVHLPK